MEKGGGVSRRKRSSSGSRGLHCGQGRLTMLRALSLILSNSSMQQIPRSLSTSAPLSRTISLVSGS